MMVTLTIGCLSSVLFAQENIMENRTVLPEQFSGWAATSAGDAFTRTTIFDYMDGAGEIYLAYDFERLFVREYGKEAAPAIVAEIYQMGSSADAYGIFTHDTDGEPIALGADAVYAVGYLRFWQGTLFVRILAERETAESKAAVLALGQTIAQAIAQESAKPALVACLPAAGLNRQSVRYFHQLVSLDVHYYLADANILNLNAQTDVVLARYQGTNPARLLLVAYPDAAAAQTAYRRFVEAYFPENPLPQADWQIAKVEKKEFVSARQFRRFLILVFEAREQAVCERLTNATTQKLAEVFE